MKIDHITSKDNAFIKKIRKASRGNSEFFILENEKLIREAFIAGFKAEVLALSFDLIEKHQELVKLAEFENTRIISVNTKLFGSLGNTVTSQGCIALFSQKYVTPEFSGGKGLFVVCDGIQDPGNMGAIIRSALGFFATAVIMLPGCASAFNSKTIRASAGACLQLPIMQMDQEQLKFFFLANNISSYALDAEAEKAINQEDYASNCAIIVGNEGAGIREETRGMIDAVLRIPTDERLESLNAAVSLSLLLYEISVRS